jgi:uncharacterized integral membrane protein
LDRRVLTRSEPCLTRHVGWPRLTWPAQTSRPAAISIVGLVLAVLVVVLGASFAWLNAGPVHLDLWVAEDEVGLPFVLFVVLLTGWVLGMVSMVGIIVRQMREIRRLRRNVKLAETEINNLRSIPIRNAH